MPVRVTTYAYPWDLGRLGVERMLREIVEHGIEAVDLAATYHPIDALSPRDGEARLFTSPRGAVHFAASAARYGRIQPRLSSHEICSVWPEVGDRARSAGLDVNAWTVTLYQPWIVDAYPDCARVLPGGDPIGSGVCPANDDVRDYLATLCADIVDQFGVSMIRLEGIMPAAYDYGWLRPRVLISVSPLARELLALCFCASCTGRAAAAGLDVERLRRTVNDAIAAELSEGRSATGTDREAGLAADAELQAFAVQHARASTELARAAVSRLDGSPMPRVSADAWSSYLLLLVAAHDDMLEERVAAVDQIVMFPEMLAERNRRLAAIASRASHPVELAMLLARLQPGDPAAHRVAASAGADEPVARQLQAVAELGVGEINLYNFGLLRERDVGDFVAAVRAAFR